MKRMNLSRQMIRACILLWVSGYIENAWNVWSSPDEPDIHIAPNTLSALYVRGLCGPPVHNGGHGHIFVYPTYKTKILYEALEEWTDKTGRHFWDVFVVGGWQDRPSRSDIREVERIYYRRLVDDACAENSANRGEGYTR